MRTGDVSWLRCVPHPPRRTPFENCRVASSHACCLRSCRRVGLVRWRLRRRDRAELFALGATRRHNGGADATAQR